MPGRRSRAVRMPRPPYRTAAESPTPLGDELAGGEQPRVSACLPLEVAVVAAEAAELRRTAVLQVPLDQLPERRRPRSHDVAARLDALERKLDLLLALVAEQRAQAETRSGTEIELSTDGATFYWAEEIAVHTTIELEITLGLVPPRRVRCLAQVRACERQGQRFRVETRFSAIRGADVDELHRYVITSQRMQRRTPEEA